jgi:hypothetical protein
MMPSPNKEVPNVTDKDIQLAKTVFMIVSLGAINIYLGFSLAPRLLSEPDTLANMIGVLVVILFVTINVVAAILLKRKYTK